jgi:hypothetical protein
MTVDEGKVDADAAKGVAVRCAYTEFLRRENLLASDNAALEFAKKAVAENIAAAGPEWTHWRIFLLVTGRTLPAG